MKVLRWLGAILGIAIAGVALVAIGARFADGPLAMLPGGALESGAWVDAPVEDWSFVAPVDEIELQLLEPVRSRTVWILFDDGKAYVPCAAPEFRLWKQWPHEAVADGRAVVRIEGRRHPVTLARVAAADRVDALVSRLRAKYPSSEGYEGEVWFFELESRS